MLKHRQVEAFRAVIISGSMSTAADILGITQPAVSRLIRDLEYETRLDLFERYDRGFFHMRGYTGEDKPDHCAHLGLMADIVKVYLTPRWHTPKGSR